MALFRIVLALELTDGQLLSQGTAMSWLWRSLENTVASCVLSSLLSNQLADFAQYAGLVAGTNIFNGYD
jgi:hypothetical protein